MTIINSYKNGNVNVTLYDDETKTREWSGAQVLQFPESLDIKITNQCDLGCEYCHESSVPNGKHAHIELLTEKLRFLPPGIELAIGGGNPMAHPNFSDLIEFTSSCGLILNLTMNHLHIKKYVDKLDFLLYNDFVRGLGISVHPEYKNYSQIDKLMNHHIVFHVIAGVHNINIVGELIERYKNPRILVLGYKSFGFGKNFFSKEVENSIQIWKMQIPKYFGKCILSFDNLAIEQLSINKWFTPNEWNSLYIGDDFTTSMYIDAVNGEYARTSRDVERVSWDLMSVMDYFTKDKYGH